MHDELSWVIVAEMPGHGAVGYAIWTRETEKPQRTAQSLRAVGLKSSRSRIPLTSRLAHRVRTAQMVEFMKTLRDPLADAERMDSLWNDYQSQRSVIAASNPAEYWYLQEVAVVPVHRFKGVGRELLHWGQHWAEKEELPMLLEANRSGRVLYHQAGFVNYGLWRWGGDRNMCWDLMRWSPPQKNRHR